MRTTKILKQLGRQVPQLLLVSPHVSQYSIQSGKLHEILLVLSEYYLADIAQNYRMIRLMG